MNLQLHFLISENIIEEVHRETFVNYFLRTHEDVMESFERVRDKLDLIELKWENCLIDCGTPQKLFDFIWSIHGHSIEESIEEIVKKFGKDTVTQDVIRAVKSHIEILVNRDFTNGSTYGSYMYLVIKRKPRLG